LAWGKMNKSKQPLKENFSFLNQSLTCGLDNSKVKDAKTNHTFSKSNHHKTLGKKKRQSRKVQNKKG